MNKSTIDRFLNLVQKTNNCWPWSGAINNKGYGRFRFNGKWAGSHRVSYLLFVGKIKKSLCVLHKCDNRKCVNPDHLFIGTVKDNYDDMVSKGRSNRASKLTDIQKQKIPLLFKNGHKKSSLAIRFGVNESCIRKIISKS